MHKTKISNFFALSLFNKRLFFAAILFWLCLACQSFQAQSEKELNTQKLLETKLSYAQKQVDLGQPEHALQVLRPLLIENPNNAEVQNMVGLTYLALSNPSRARLHFRKAYDIDHTVVYGLNLSSALIATGLNKQAIKLLVSLLKEPLYPYKERLLHNLALSFEKMRQYRKAVHFYKKALDENPSYYLSNIRLGKTYQKIGNEPLAIEAFEKATLSCAECFEPHYELAVAYINQHQDEKAITVLTQFLNQKIPNEEREQAKNLLSLANRTNSLTK